ncbi:ATP-binding cassette domain-containing protein [Croceicoccus mobilis]|uniref:ATP-binding protein n=1 Tax=Croceicoccus mobilis TaxID=1703339 RepID=A0A917DXI9_9SPHN|nr:ATP-binding cassette domain-containing protein [Croceicoccus mobilis]GGD80975.1 ATP-binding protein [Croceicoccus mobilis]
MTGAAIPVGIEIHDLKVVRAGRAILKVGHLVVEGGSLTAIVGPSGAGKTTLLRSINRLVDDYAGTILLDGKDTRAQSAEQLRRRIGYVLQHIGLLPHRTVAENIALPARIAGEAADPDRIRELLKLLQLPGDLGQRDIASLSGGQAQRVAIARAMYRRPRVMLMDEPFGALDPATRWSLGTAYRDLQRGAGQTTIMVTHDVAEALSLADRVIVIDGGMLAAHDEPAVLVRSADERVRALIDPPIGHARQLAALGDRAGKGA